MNIQVVVVSYTNLPGTGVQQQLGHLLEYPCLFFRALSYEKSQSYEAGGHNSHLHETNILTEEQISLDGKISLQMGI